jgi:hypothetical protein
MYAKAVTRFLPASRIRLTGYSFVRLETGVWELALPDLYAKLFELQEPALFKKAQQGWHDRSEQDGKKVCHCNFTDAEVDEVRKFLADYVQWVILGLGRHLKPFFSDELDMCIALALNADSPEAMARYERTPIGQLEFRAKYEESERATAVIASHMNRLLRRICRGLPRGQYSLSYIPSSADKQYDLPGELVRKLEEKLSKTVDFEKPIEVVHPVLKSSKPLLKKLPLSEKIDTWKTLQESQAIDFSGGVAGRTVIVVDDLYQSGATIWSYARYLKMMGATAVIGLVCVKSCRDTDNL